MLGLSVTIAAALACQPVAFGEALCPSCPFWIERTDGARFNSPVQKELHAHYLDQAVQIERGDLGEVRNAAALPIPLHGVSAVTGEGRIYVVGGSTIAAAAANSGRLFAFQP